tara:strand:+ start:1137 stop:1886 length:750 start_codon:yes stop_codon:yes gene_type:complete
MRVGFVITSHYSDRIRPQGQEILTRIIDSILEYCKYDFNIYIIDNESQYDLQFPKDERIKYTRIDNQFEKGLTGAWNLGLNIAYEDGCDFLIQCNDDLWFNDTINFWIKAMSELDEPNGNNVVYAAMTNGVFRPSHQYADKEKDTNEILRLNCKSGDYGDTPNGFCFAFSNKHYEKFRYKEDEYFNQNHKHCVNDGKWGGQEGQFIENSEKGLFCLVIKGCFIHHDKIRDWRQARTIDEEENGYRRDIK